MEKTIGPLQANDRTAAEALWHHCFPDDEDAFITLYFDRFFAPQNAWGVFIDGVLAADLFMPLLAKYSKWYTGITERNFSQKGGVSHAVAHNQIGR